MTDNELLDRRIEQLVVDTVRRELRRDEEQKARIAQSLMPDGTQVAQTVSPGDFVLRQADGSVTVLSEEQALALVRSTDRTDLTTAVLLEALRRANLRAGEYARSSQTNNNECVELRSKLEDRAKKLGQQKTQIEELNKTCVRLIDERDKYGAQVVLLIKERDDAACAARVAIKERDAAQEQLGFSRHNEEHFRNAYNELAKATA